METEAGCSYDRVARDNGSPSSERAGSPPALRGCSPSEQLECSREGLSDIATEVTIHATGDPTVSSLICSGLQAVHGAPEREQPERAWEEDEPCEVAEQQLQIDHSQCVEEPLQQEQVLETYTTSAQVDTSIKNVQWLCMDKRLCKSFDYFTTLCVLIVSLG